MSPPSAITPASAHPYRNATASIDHTISPSRNKPIPLTSPPPHPQPPAPIPELPAPPPPPLVDRKPPLPVIMATTEDGTNITVLAREVAAVLSQGQLEARGGNRDTGSSNSSSRVESPAPPRYRATMT
ncbi:hypothetical protein C0991_005412 [Blastosporella zonata]|nr:hypothetical protein C0991_005412 [Blastosporella zonata]